MGVVNYFEKERMKKIMLHFLSDRPHLIKGLHDEDFIYAKSFKFEKVRYYAKEKLVLKVYDSESDRYIRFLLLSDTLVTCHNYVMLEEAFVSEHRTYTNTYRAWYDENFRPYAGDEKLFCEDISK